MSQGATVNQCADPILRVTGHTSATTESIYWKSRNASGRELETVSLMVHRTGDTSRPASVEFHTVDGTAVAGRDYVGQAGRVDFAPWKLRVRSW